MKKILVLCAMLFAFVFPAAVLAQFEEGHEYRVLYSQPPVDKNAPLEVVEFFWYGCPHCYHFEPHIKGWEKAKPEDVRFVKMPATFLTNEELKALDKHGMAGIPERHRARVLHAYSFYALDLMGEAERMNDVIFEAMHKKGNRLANQEAMEKLLEENGVNVETYRKAMKSFVVHSKTKRASNLFNTYNLRGVPSIAVNGRFTSGDVRSNQDLVKVIDHMLTLVKEEQAGGK